MQLYQLLILVFLVSCSYKDKVAKSKAFYLNLGSEPNVINPITSTDAYASGLHGYIFEGLLTRDSVTYEWKPAIAKKWKISKDNRVFTFYLREDAYFHDNKNITAEDVKFSYDVIFDDRFNAAHKRPYLESISEVKIIDKYTVQFSVKDSYYRNFDNIAGGILEILPKHFYGNIKNKKLFNKKLIGSGPYKFSEYQRGQYFVLEKNKNWWGNELYPKEHNFERIILRFIKNNTVALEMLKKFRFDYIGMKAEVYLKKTTGPEWGKEVLKVKTENKTPKSYMFIGWNLKHPILKSRNVRKALFKLVNRKFMIEKFEYNMSEIARGPVANSSYYFNSELPLIKFAPKEALRILKSEGWSDSDNDNILDKVINGKKTNFSITILEPNASYVKYLTVFKEDALKIGIDINIKLIEWSSFIKLIDEKKFDAVRLGWGGGGQSWDPKQIWHSESINGGSNFISYSNKKVDKLIDEARQIYDQAERRNKLFVVQELIADDYPYVWFSFSKYSLYGHTSRIYKDRDTYPYDIGTSYWKLKSDVNTEKEMVK